MTKAELIDAVAGAAGTSKSDAEKVIDAFVSQIVEGAKKGDKVAWPGFGSFSVTTRAARTGRNPQTGQEIKVAASKALKFSPSSTLKAALNPGRK